MWGAHTVMGGCSRQREKHRGRSVHLVTRSDEGSKDTTCYTSACLVWSGGEYTGTEASLSQIQTSFQDGFLDFCFSNTGPRAGGHRYPGHWAPSQISELLNLRINQEASTADMRAAPILLVRKLDHSVLA